jgi:uncharacterized protein (UPF0335 family)
MRIEVKCPHCGADVKIDVHKVERLEKENAELRARIKGYTKEAGASFEDLLKIFGGKT